MSLVATMLLQTGVDIDTVAEKVTLRESNAGDVCQKFILQVYKYTVTIISIAKKGII